MGHLRVLMMRQNYPSTNEHELQVSSLLKGMKCCEFCALEKLVLQPHIWKLPRELPIVLQRFQEEKP